MLDHVSHSQISMWLRCPQQWEYRYVRGLKAPPSSALILGGAYHSALEVNFKQKINSGEDLPVDSCLDAFSDSWNYRLKETETILWENKDQNMIKDQGINLVREYQITTSSSVQPVKVEETYIKEVAGVKFLCIVDLVNVQEEVIDHKTSARAYTQEDVDKSLQANAEAFALGRGIAFQNHVAIKTKVPRIQIVKSYRTSADIDWWYLMVARILIHMKSGIAPPNPTQWSCSGKWCGYHNLCRKGLARSIF